LNLVSSIFLPNSHNNFDFLAIPHTSYFSF
jgi:hypothetical protein